MESKSRTLIALAVTLLFVIAIMTSFWRTLFSSSSVEIVLPQVTTASLDEGSEQFDIAIGSVALTPSTVQAIIASLTHAKSYYRVITTVLYHEEQSRELTVETWFHQGVTRVRKALPSGIVRHDMIDGDTVYYWYEGDARYLTTPAESYSADLAQSIPTYQTVLALDPTDITVARYELKETIPCIFVEAKVDSFGYRVRYWVDIETGLLVSAEIWDDDSRIYQMQGFSAIQSPVPDWVDFRLPDGTDLILELP